MTCACTKARCRAGGIQHLWCRCAPKQRRRFSSRRGVPAMSKSCVQVAHVHPDGLGRPHKGGVARASPGRPGRLAVSASKCRCMMWKLKIYLRKRMRTAPGWHNNGQAWVSSAVAAAARSGALGFQNLGWRHRSNLQVRCAVRSQLKPLWEGACTACACLPAGRFCPTFAHQLRAR